MVTGQNPATAPRIWQVGALCRAIADALDARFNPVAVRGEITGFSRASSGHCYFSIKDANGQLRCAMFRRAAGLLDFLPRDGELAGFVFGRHGFNFQHIGPVIAKDTDAACQLVSAALETQHGKAVILDAAHHSSEWLNWLEAAGFREQRPFVRMLRGKGSLPGKPEYQFAILGPEFG